MTNIPTRIDLHAEPTEHNSAQATLAVRGNLQFAHRISGGEVLAWVRKAFGCEAWALTRPRVDSTEDPCEWHVDLMFRKGVG